MEGEDLNAAVVGRGNGTAVITAVVTADVNGEASEIPVQGEILVTVTEDDLNLKITPEQMELKKGESGKLRVSSSHDSAITGILWSSGADGIATVKPINDKGTEAGITAVKEGKTLITVKVTASINGKQEVRTLSVPVTVLAADDNFIFYGTD